MDSSIIVKNIKILCRENGISIASLEKKINLSPGLISRWTKVMPSLDRLIDVAQFFDVSLDYIIGNQSGRSLISREKTLVDTLNTNSIIDNIKWHFLPLQSDSLTDHFGEYFTSILSADHEYDCFYATFENGFFLLKASYPAGSGTLDSLTLYVFPDKHTAPHIQSENISLLDALYQTIREKLDQDLSEYKANHFVNHFLTSLNDHSDQNYEETDAPPRSSKITKIG